MKIIFIAYHFNNESIQNVLNLENDRVDKKIIGELVIGEKKIIPIFTPENRNEKLSDEDYYKMKNLIKKNQKSNDICEAILHAPQFSKKQISELKTILNEILTLISGGEPDDAYEDIAKYIKDCYEIYNKGKNK